MRKPRCSRRSLLTLLEEQPGVLLQLRNLRADMHVHLAYSQADGLSWTGVQTWSSKNEA